MRSVVSKTKKPQYKTGGSVPDKGAGKTTTGVTNNYQGYKNPSVDKVPKAKVKKKGKL